MSSLSSWTANRPQAGCIDPFVPASADEQVLPFRDDVDHRLSFWANGAQQVGRSVRRVVVHDDQVEGEGGLLLQDRADGIADGLDPVLHRDDDRGFVGERRPRRGWGS